MTNEHDGPQISLENLIDELERVITQIRDLPDGPSGRTMEALEAFENFRDRVRERYHIDHGPLSYFVVPPGRKG